MHIKANILDMKKAMVLPDNASNIPSLLKSIQERKIIIRDAMLNIRSLSNPSLFFKNNNMVGNSIIRICSKLYDVILCKTIITTNVVKEIAYFIYLGFMGMIIFLWIIIKIFYIEELI